MKKSFVLIRLNDFIELHLRTNPEEKRDNLIKQLSHAIEARQRGECCSCGKPIWIVGSVYAGLSCFTCITGEAEPDTDLEIDDRDIINAAGQGLTGVPEKEIQAGSRGKILIDLEELQMAFKDSGSGEAQYYLDKQTGEVIFSHPDLEDIDEISEKIEQDGPSRYQWIERMEARKGFCIMEEFIETITQPKLKSQLLAAISRPQPFRHFRNIVHSDWDLREKWFTFEREAMADHARRWLKIQSIDAELKLRKR